MSASAQRALIGGFPPVPLFYGGTLLGDLVETIRRSENMTIWSFLPRGHRPLPVQNLMENCAEMTPPALA